MPTISVCMIVKNEENFLGRCLNSIKEYVDEIIVVDTGSTDKTKEVAQSLGAKVYDFTWINDFAAARQFAKEQASCEWILQLDADEYFLPGEGVQLKEEIKKTSKNAIAIRISNLVGDNQLGPTHIFCRLFKNLPEVHYQYKIHEQVAINGEPVEFEYTNIRLMHTGYTQEMIDGRKKHDRNLAILEKELEDDKENGFTYLNFSNEYLAMGEFEKCIEYAQNAFKYGSGKSYQPKAVMNIVSSLMQMKEYDKALEVIADAKEFYIGYTDLTFMEGLTLESQGRFEEAKKAYHACIEAGESKPIYQTKKGISSIFPLERLGAISLKNRDFQNALSYYDSVTRIDKYNDVNVATLFSILRRGFSDNKIIEFLEEKYDDSTQANITIKLKIMHAFRMKEGICQHIEKFKGIVKSDDYETQLYINLYNGENEKAKEIVLDMIERGERNAELYTIVCWLYTLDSELEGLIKKRFETATLIVEVLQGVEKKEDSLEKKYDLNLYVKVLQELNLLRRYDEFEALMSIAHLFPEQVYREIGNIFFSSCNDDLAIQYFVKYLQHDGKDDELTTIVSMLLLSLGMNQEAIVFAKGAFSLNQKNFKPIEVLIEANKALGNEEAIISICEAALQLFPKSKYIIEQLECVI